MVTYNMTCLDCGAVATTLMVRPTDGMTQGIACKCGGVLYWVVTDVDHPPKTDSHDAHYTKLGIEPCTIVEQFLETNTEGMTRTQAHNLGAALNYLARAGLKEEWTKDVEKAQNYLYRALHGCWPWNAKGVTND